MRRTIYLVGIKAPFAHTQDVLFLCLSLFETICSYVAYSVEQEYFSFVCCLNTTARLIRARTQRATLRLIPLIISGHSPTTPEMQIFDFKINPSATFSKVDLCMNEGKLAFCLLAHTLLQFPSVHKISVHYDRKGVVKILFTYLP